MGSAHLTLNAMLSQLQTWLATSPDSGKLWDILTSLRGPDSGEDEDASERPSDDHAVHTRRYRARVNRKMQTVAVIRAASGLYGGSARRRDADHVVLPPPSDWDHFDKHVARAAAALGLRVESRPRSMRHRC